MKLAAATLDRQMEILLSCFFFFFLVGTRLILLTVNNEVLLLSDRADALCVILESVVGLRHFFF